MGGMLPAGGGQLLQFPGAQAGGGMLRAASWSAYDRMIQKTSFLNFLINRMAS